MADVHRIIVADRNPRIREFLRRELTAMGNIIRIVENGEELLALVCSDQKIDLVVLDPDLPCTDIAELVRTITLRIPHLPVVFHSVPGSDNVPCPANGDLFQIEKNGNSIETIKDAIEVIFTNKGF